MILLVTYFSWDAPTGGACITRHFVEKLSGEPIHWFALSHPTGHVPFRASHVTHEYISAPAWGNVRFRLGRFWRWYNRVCWASYAAVRIERRRNNLHARVTWIVADYTLASVGRRLLAGLAKTRVHVSIHDHPQASAEREGYGREDLSEVAAFQAMLATFQPTVDGVSEQLIEMVMPGVSRKSVIALPAVANETAPTLAAPEMNGLLRVGLSGNFYGQVEFNCFLEGLERWRGRSERDWRLVVVGKRPEQIDHRIETHSYCSIDKVRRELARCDVLLLPLPVDSSSIQMRTSVPTKLTTYLEVGKLVFAFAPAESVTERLIAENAIGPVVTRLDPAMVAAQLDRISTWDLAAANAGRQRLLAHHYSEQRMLSDLTNLLST